MSNVIPFISEEFSVRVVEIDGEPWFVGKDVAGELGYQDPTTAIRSHCKGVQKHHPLQTPGGVQTMRILSEPDVLRLIVGSSLPAAERFERWVFEEVLPSIRKTGAYQRPMSTLEVIHAQSGALLEMERQQAQQREALERVENRVEQVAASVSTLSQRPANSEAITHIRPRMFRLYGLPAHVCDQALRQLPYSPKPAGMVRNAREEAVGSSYAVYWTKDVNAVFRQFVSECTRITTAFATHPFIERRFRLSPAVEAQE